MSATREPFMPFFVGQFFAAIDEWKGIEQGLYALLLMKQWSIGSLPSELEDLRLLARYTESDFARAWPRVSTKFVLGEDGRLRNIRAEEHREKSAEIASMRSDVGRRGAAARWQKHGKPMANAMNDDGNSHSFANSKPNAIIPSHPIPSHPNGSVLPTSPQGPTLCVSSPDSRAKNPDDHEGWLRVKAAYPRFSGRQDWLNAEHHCHIRISEGLTWSQLTEAAERYAKFVAAGGVSGPKFVLTPAKFFSGADRPWLQPWDPPPTKAEQRLNANVAAAAVAKQRLFGRGKS